jgi:hypothetical protein
MLAQVIRKPDTRRYIEGEETEASISTDCIALRNLSSPVRWRLRSAAWMRTKTWTPFMSCYPRSRA